MTEKRDRRIPANEQQTVQAGLPDRRKTTHLAFYPARWKNLLEDAKRECWVQHAIENPFPNLVEGLKGLITEALSTAFSMWEQAGKEVESGKFLVSWRVRISSLVRFLASLQARHGETGKYLAL